MIIGHEKDQRELLSLLEKEKSQFCAIWNKLIPYGAVRFE